MAIINCPECDKEISTNAIACPNCGFNLREFINQQQFNVELEKLSQQIPMPKNPLIDTYAVLDYFLTILYIVIIILFKPYSDTVVLLLSLLVLFMIQLCFVPIMKKQFKNYNNAKTDLREYQKEMLLADMKRLERKTQNSNIGIHYFISALIPLYGWIIGAKLLFIDKTQQGSICICISCLSFLIGYSIFL